MSNADGERIAPVTPLFGARPQQTGEWGRPDSPPVEPPEPHRHAEPSAAPESRGASGSRRGSESRGDKREFDPINNVSLNALARRGMSSQEMRDYLLGREFELEQVEVEVERLESVALLDDAALAETLVRTLRERKGLGRSALAAELRRRRLDGLAIELSLGALDDDELERATEIAHKRASQLRSYDAETAKRRLGSFLLRKGYSGSVVSTAVQRALAPASGPTFR